MEKFTIAIKTNRNVYGEEFAEKPEWTLIGDLCYGDNCWFNTKKEAEEELTKMHVDEEVKIYELVEVK